MKRSLVRLARRARNSAFLWRYVYNLKPSIRFARHHPELQGEADRLLQDLRRDGLALTTADKLLGNESCFEELTSAVQGLQDQLKGELDAGRELANEPDPDKPKTFLHQLLGRHPELDPESIYARFAMQNEVLGVANNYFRMFTKLELYNVWVNFVTDSDARESQLWHRDREDLHILKVFVYLSQVDRGAGPFTYAMGTHIKKRPAFDPDLFRQPKPRYTDEQMEEIVSSERWREAAGPPGTIVFADTTGYHKGGLARESERLMYLCAFTSQVGTGHIFKRGAPVSSSDPSKSFALSPRRFESGVA